MWYTVPTLHNTVSAVGKESFMKRQHEEYLQKENELCMSN